MGWNGCVQGQAPADCEWLRFYSYSLLGGGGGCCVEREVF